MSLARIGNLNDNGMERYSVINDIVVQMVHWYSGTNGTMIYWHSDILGTLAVHWYASMVVQKQKVGNYESD